MKQKEDTVLYLVVPCYNEEEVLLKTTMELEKKLTQLMKDKLISKNSMVLYVNDGSRDSTWELIEQIGKEHPLFTGISLSRNRGHQNALVAGLMVAKNYADIVISMDADLQDDIQAIDGMIDSYYKGFDIVYGVRSSRKNDTWFKRTTAEGFYLFMKFMGVEVIFNHADYRLTSKRVLEQFENFKEVNLFLRGMFPLIGYSSDVVYYERKKRLAGESKYPLKKMLSFAWDGITSFSVRPLKFITSLGFLMVLISIFVLIYSLVIKIIGQAVSGWTFIVCSIWLVGGIQMLSLGIIGEYIGKIYSEAKARPRYIIAKNLLEEQLEKKKKKNEKLITKNNSK